MRVRGPSKARRGAAMVEAALTFPLFFLLILGLIEFGRMGLVAQELTTAAREGCRMAIINGHTVGEAEDRVEDYMDRIGVETYSLTWMNADAVENSSLGDPVSLTISVNYRDVSWLPTPRFLGSATIRASATLSSERP